MAILHWHLLSAVYVLGSMKYMVLWTKKKENEEKWYSSEEQWNGNEILGNKKVLKKLNRK